MGSATGSGWGQRRGGGAAGGAEELLEFGQDGLADDGRAGLGLLDEAADIVLGRERDVDEVVADRNLAATDAVEGGLEVVGEGGDLLEAEHGARALDGVQGAEGGVDQGAVLGPVAEVEQGRLQAGQKLGGFGPEDVGWIESSHGTVGPAHARHRYRMNRPASSEREDFDFVTGRMSLNPSVRLDCRVAPHPHGDAKRRSSAARFRRLYIIRLKIFG